VLNNESVFRENDGGNIAPFIVLINSAFVDTVVAVINPVDS
jgi:hypothetical protein